MCRHVWVFVYLPLVHLLCERCGALVAVTVEAVPGGFVWAFRVVEGPVSRPALVELGHWCAALVRQQVVFQGPGPGRGRRRRRNRAA